MTWTAVESDALKWLRSLPTGYASLAVTSPPYAAARTYGIDAARKSADWVTWLRPIVVEMCRVADIVAMNVADQVIGCKYQGGDLHLITDLMRLDGIVLGPAPYAWVKAEDEPDSFPNGQPGSGGPYYQRRDWEPVYILARPENLPPKWTDNTAFGHRPRWAPGGAMSHRLTDGTRRNQWGGAAESGTNRTKTGERETPKKKPSHVVQTKAEAERRVGNPPGPTRRANGEQKKRLGRGGDGDPKGGPKGRRVPAGSTVDGETIHDDVYLPPAISNPGNVICAGVGGGRMGHPLAHEGEAPMSLGVAERFVCWFCPPDGMVIDPFCGTGTTGHAAKKHGRRFAGCDLRASQVGITARRLRSIETELFS